MATQAYFNQIQSFDVQATSTVSDAISQVALEVVDKVKSLFESCKKLDAFNDCIFDFSTIPTFINKQEFKIVKTLLPTIINEQAGKHVIGLKLLNSQVRIA